MRRSPNMRLLTLAAVFALVLPVVAEPYNITFTDESPTITYLPSRSGNESETWRSDYTGSGGNLPVQGSLGSGDSYHYTTANGASASVGFVGTAVYVYGYNYGNDSDVQIQIGGQDLDRGQNETELLGWKTGLKNQWWEVTINVTTTDPLFRGIDLRQITLTVDFGGRG